MSIIDRFRLTGKKAIVTGAAQGIGLATALKFAGADGARLACAAGCAAGALGWVWGWGTVEMVQPPSAARRTRAVPIWRI